MGNAVLDVRAPTHKSVMRKETIDYLITRPDGSYVDATLGLGGHSRSILEFTNDSCRVIGLDVDERAIEISMEGLSGFGGRFIARNDNFSNIDGVLTDLGIRKVDGIVADLGVSSFQIESSGKGFSFNRNEPLDMRMDSRIKFTAADLVNEMSKDAISDILKSYGEEKWASRIAKRIVARRKDNVIRTSGELAKLVSSSIPIKFQPARIHPATKTFQAFRIAVNNELRSLEEFIGKSISLLSSGGRLVIISFHSLEDRLVKSQFRLLASSCVCPPAMPECGCAKRSVLRTLTRSPITPTPQELSDNPRARSAKMRVGEKI